MTPLELIEARQDMHMKQVDLARALGVAPNTVNRWEAGTREIPPYLWLALIGLRHQKYGPWEHP